MDATKIREVIERYKAKFAFLEVGATSFPHGKTPTLTQQKLGHCSSMLAKMEGFIEEGRMDKVMRWLGFIQGVLWSEGVYTLDDLTHHNRKD